MSYTMYRFANCSIWASFEGDCLGFRQHFIESGKHLPNHALCNLVNILKSSVLLLQSRFSAHYFLGTLDCELTQGLILCINAHIY